jgi:hypothetical protein
MHRPVARVAPRNHVPLRASVKNPQRRFEHFTRCDGLATRATFGNVLLGRMLPNPFPLRWSRQRGLLIESAAEEPEAHGAKDDAY